MRRNARQETEIVEARRRHTTHLLPLHSTGEV